MIKARKIELLAPARDLQCGIEAINHGADAVYIGAPRFGARVAVGNSLDDIRQLVNYAHQFGARIYVTLNTILSDEELEDARKLIWELYRIGTDALIIQDMGILMLELPPIPIHASTQIDNRTIEKIKFLQETGFSQVVLARELSLDEIRKIADNVSAPLEVFVHGALCVSYSGQCYLSQAITKRSANRGECAQLCRLPYQLTDAEGKQIVSRKHLLSLKDLNLSEHLEELLDAGVSSLKIEGRLKDVGYVKNVVAYYRQKLDNIFSRRNEYYRSSSGESYYNFTPDLSKSFNRGYTTYFLYGRTENIWSVDSPKSIGEPIGKVKEVFDRFFVLSGTKKLSNGDGVCFFENGELQGLRVNRIDGERVFFAENNIRIRKGTFVYRNFDHEFNKILSNKTAERKIEIDIIVRETPAGFAIDAIDTDGKEVSLAFDYEKLPAQKDQKENISSNLSKTGNTIFKVNSVEIFFSESWFIPASIISDWRRKITEKLLQVRLMSHRHEIKKIIYTSHPFNEKKITYLGNVMNEKSRQFYIQHQSDIIQPAFEKQPQKNVPLMFTRHCIKYSLGYCPKESPKPFIYKEPFYLTYNNTRLKLHFDCNNCEMKVVEE